MRVRRKPARLYAHEKLQPLTWPSTTSPERPRQDTSSPFRRLANNEAIIVHPAKLELLPRSTQREAVRKSGSAQNKCLPRPACKACRPSRFRGLDFKADCRCQSNNMGQLNEQPRQSGRTALRLVQVNFHSELYPSVSTSFLDCPLCKLCSSLGFGTRVLIANVFQKKSHERQGRRKGNRGEKQQTPTLFRTVCPSCLAGANLYQDQ